MKDKKIPYFRLRALTIKSELYLIKPNRKNQQTHRDIHHGTIKIEPYPKIVQTIVIPEKNSFSPKLDFNY